MKLKKNSTWYSYLLLFPALTILIGLFMGGVILALSQSLGYFPLLGLKDFTLQYYLEVWSSPEFIDSLKFSLFISLVSSIMAVIVGVFLAYQLVKIPKEHRLVKLIYKLPIIVPHIIASLMVFIIFTQSGFLSRILYHLGIIPGINRFPQLIFDRWGAGIILVYLWKEVPFVALIVFTVLKHINNSWEEVAHNLGANRKQVFWNIYLPLSLPSIGTSFIIIFAFSFGAFEIPLLLGPTYPQTLPVLAYKEYINPDLMQRPYAIAITMTLTVVSLFLIYFYKKLLKLVLRYQ